MRFVILVVLVLAAALPLGAQKAPASWRAIHVTEQSEWWEYVDGAAVTAMATLRPVQAIGDALLRANGLSHDGPTMLYRVTFSGADDQGLSFELKEAKATDPITASYLKMVSLNHNVVFARDLALWTQFDTIDTLFKTVQPRQI